MIEAGKLKKEKMAAQSRQRRFKDELKLQKAKLEQRMKYEKKLEEQGRKTVDKWGGPYSYIRVHKL